MQNVRLPMSKLGTTDYSSFGTLKNPINKNKQDEIPFNESKQSKPFIPPLGGLSSYSKPEKEDIATTGKAKEELRKTSLSIFPKDIQSLAEYRQYEDKQAKMIGTAQLPYWFIESTKSEIPQPKRKVILL